MAGTDPSLLLDELERLDSTFNNKTEKVELALQNMDVAEKERLEQRKQLIRKEYSKALLYLNYRDQETVKLVRSATMEALLRTKQQISNLRTLIKEGHRNRFQNVNLRQAQQSFHRLIEEVEFLRRNTELEVGLDPSQLQTLLEQAVYVKTKDCDPKQFRLVIQPGFEPRTSVVAEPPHSFRSELIQNTMELTFRAVNLENRTTSSIPVFKASLKDLIKNGRAVVVSDLCVELNLPPSPTGFAELDVSVFGVYVRDGAQRQMSIAVSKPGDMSRFLDDTVAVVGRDEAGAIDQSSNRDLDQSDICSLDMTTRNRLVVRDDQQDSSRCLPKPLRKNLSVVEEVTEEGRGLNDTTPFSPLSDRCQFSTMRETSAAMLGVMLASIDMEMPEPGAELECSVLAPSNSSGRRSVEEMQRSLSRENSPVKELVDLPAAERSIIFSAKTTIFEELSTPQVKVDRKRYTVKEGETKVADGIAGISKRSQKTSGSGTSEQKTPNNSIWDDEEEENQSLLQISSQVPFPLPSSQNPSMTEEEEPGKTAELEPSKPTAVTEMESFWNTSQDSFWDESTDEGGDSSQLNESVWDVEPVVNRFNFITCDLVPEETFHPKDFKGLETPGFLTWIKQHQVLLITDPVHNRVGVHDDTTLSFQGLFPSPEEGGSFRCPLHVLALADGTVALLHRPGLDLYRLPPGETNYRQVERIPGRYKGLAEAEDGDILTLQTVSGAPHVRIFSKVGGKGRYEEGDCFEITVATTKRPGIVALPRNLVYYQRKIYITDMGISRIYVVDTTTGEQFCYGYYGTGEGHFKKPLAILQDDSGHMLVADNESGQILVFNNGGQFVKTVELQTQLTRPMAFLRRGNSILLTYMGDGEKNQGIIRFGLEPIATRQERKDSPVMEAE